MSRRPLFTFHDESGAEQEFIAADCIGPLSKAAPISTEEFAFLKTAAKTAEPKITMPSPSTLHFWRMSKTIEGSVTRRTRRFSTICARFPQEIADLRRFGLPLCPA